MHTCFWVLIWRLTIFKGYCFLITTSLKLFELRLVFSILRLQLRLKQVTWLDASVHYFRWNCAKLEWCLSCIVMNECSASDEAHRNLAFHSWKVVVSPYVFYLTLKIFISILFSKLVGEKWCFSKFIKFLVCLHLTASIAAFLSVVLLIIDLLILLPSKHQ